MYQTCGQCCVFRNLVVGSNIVIGLYVLDKYSPYDDRYIRCQQPHMEHKTLTTYPIRSFQSLY